MLMWRVITAIILIPLVLLGIFKLSPMAFAISSAVIFFLAAIEWTNLLPFKMPSKAAFLMGFSALLLLLFFKGQSLMLWLGTLFWVMPLYWCLTYRGEAKGFLANTYAKSLMGWVCLGSAFVALVTIHQLTNGPLWILLLFLLIWSTDTFAYFAGRAFGKHKLAPKISPNKTIEGFLGGVVGAMIVAAFSVAVTPLPAFTWFMIAFVTILLGVLGDLYESLMKRLANVKDSGRLLPGHGGILDRLDSLIAALPFYALCLTNQFAS